MTRNGSYGQVLAHLARTYVVCTYRPCARKLSLLVRLSTAVGPCMFFVWTRSIWRFNAQRTSNKNYNQPRIQTIIHTQRKRQQEKAVISQPRQSVLFVLKYHFTSYVVHFQCLLLSFQVLFASGTRYIHTVQKTQTRRRNSNINSRTGTG